MSFNFFYLILLLLKNHHSKVNTWVLGYSKSWNKETKLKIKLMIALKTTGEQ